MMKKDFLKKAVVAFGATMAVVAIPAFMAYGTATTQDPAEDPKEPYCITVTADPNGSISGAGYVGEAIYTDADGNKHSRGTFGFDIEIRTDATDNYDADGNFINTTYTYELEYVNLRSVKAGENEAAVYLPDAISLTHEGQKLTHEVDNVTFYYYTPEQGMTEWNSFVDSPDLKNVYVGPSARNVQWYGEDFLKLRNFHFRSEEVPNFYFGSGSNGTINIYVPEELFAQYTEVINGADYTATVWSEAPLSPVYVNVDIPGTLADAISSNIDNLSSVRWLVVTGTPNEQDLRIMRRLPRLEILDLSATKGLETVVGCDGLKYLREVTLPEGVKEIGKDAFRQCTALQYVALPSSLIKIGQASFHTCTSLTEIRIPEKVETIDSEAFRSSSIQSINLDHVKYFREASFHSTKLVTVDLSNAIQIDHIAFAHSPSIQEVILKKVQSISSFAFESADLKSVVIPNSCQTIDWNAFATNYNLKEIELGSGLKSIYGSIVDFNVPLEKVTTRTLFPTERSGFADGNLEKATLYVPALTLNEYLLADGWTMFKNIQPLNEELDDIKIDRTFMLTSDRGIANGATLSLIRDDYMAEGYGHLTVRRNINAPLNLGKYYQEGRKELSELWTNEGYKYENRYYGSTLIPYSEMTADQVEVKMQLQTGRWHFISLPFDVNVKDIKVTDETLWVVRKYSGADRAALNEKTWVNMIDGDVLKAGEGYIFHCANDNRSEVEFTFTPASKESGNKLFAKDAVSYELTEYASEFAHNASWNLVGNTYPAYLNIRALGFDGPITHYNGSTYTAYSPVDDDFVFDPFQAFFVQRQDTEDGDKLTLKPEGRAHSKEEAAALSISRAKAPAFGNTANRALFNIHIAGENGADRARVVVNEAAAMAYEKNRDASKFMSSEKEVPQIYVMNDNRRMAIDERPLGNGEISLGTYFGEKGEYTISLDTRDADGYTVTLIDNKTGIRTDLTASDYTFEADAATDQTRFTLVLNAQATGAEAIEATGVKISVEGNMLSITAPEEIEIAVVAADGKTVASGRAARFEAVLENGVYAVKAGDNTKKIMVK